MIAIIIEYVINGHHIVWQCIEMRTKHCYIVIIRMNPKESNSRNVVQRGWGQRSSQFSDIGLLHLK
jgi:hypothetical protein